MTEINRQLRTVNGVGVRSHRNELATSHGDMKPRYEIRQLRLHATHEIPAYSKHPTAASQSADANQLYTTRKCLLFCTTSSLLSTVQGNRDAPKEVSLKDFLTYYLTYLD